MRRAVIVGRSRGALAEYCAACELCSYDEVLVVGMMGAVFPDRIDHWVSFHSASFGLWAKRREANGLPPAGCYWHATHRGRRLALAVPQGSVVRCVQQRGGSSGLMAYTVARVELGCERIVLAGVPLQADHGHAEEARSPRETGRWTEADTYWRAWVPLLAEMRQYTRSMSGRTRKELGEPTRAWLLGT